jgi:hypothetical protein
VRNNRRLATVLRAVAVAAAGSVLVSCSALGIGGKASSAGSPSPGQGSGSPADGLTRPGSRLAFGDTATVRYKPDQKRSTRLELTVKDASLGSMKDFSGFILDDQSKASSPYYVDVVVKNVGDGAIGGGPVPLWGVDARNTLLPAATFTTSFPKCPSKPLPAKFGPGDRYRACLVYLAPDNGTMTSVSYRPDQAFDPVRWTGKIATQAPGGKASPTKKPAKGR